MSKATAKRLLMVAYYFEPQTSVGVFRTVRLAKHLLSQGWEVEVLSVANPDPQFEPVRAALPTDLLNQDGVTVHAVKAAPVKPLWQWPTAVASKVARAMNARFDEAHFAGRLWHIDMQWGFARALKKPLGNLLRSGRFDAIYVSCPPFSSAEPAVQCAKKFDVPVILDFRDSWVVSPYASAGTKKYDVLEREMLQQAGALIVNTPADLEAYGRRTTPEKVHWLPNGFDAPMQGPFERNTEHALRLTYLGAWDDGPRNPRPLLAALKQVSWDWHLSNYANDHGALQRAAADLGVNSHISYYEFVPKSQIRTVIEASDALVLVQGRSADKSAPVTHIAAKTFDYLATGRMILGLVADGANKDILLQHKDHSLIAAPDDQVEISAALEKLHAAWQGGALPATPDAAFLQSYSETSLGNRFEEICNRVIASSATK